MRPHDAAYKLLFSFPEMVRDLLAGFVPREWVEELDLSTLERWPGSHVSDDLRQRHQDRVWRVRFHDRWLYVLVLLEFQSTVDRTMAVRILAYTALLYQDLLRASSDALPPVLPIVLYHGCERWTAPEAVSDILDEWLSGPAHQGLKRAFDEWIRQAIAPAKVRGVEWPPVEKQGDEEGAMLLRETAKEWPRQWLEEGRAKGLAEGRAEGQTEVMRRQAARKFDAGTAERLAERLKAIADPERVAEIGEWLIECEHGDELLDRVEGLCGTPATGDDPSRR